MPVVAPALWAVHFTLCYITAALWCGRFGPPASPGLRIAVAGYTAVALAAMAMLFLHGLRRHHYRLPIASARRRLAGGPPSLRGLHDDAARGTEPAGHRVCRGLGLSRRGVRMMRRVSLTSGLASLAAVWLGPLPEICGRIVCRAHGHPHDGRGDCRTAPGDRVGWQLASIRPGKCRWPLPPFPRRSWSSWWCGCGMPLRSITRRRPVRRHSPPNRRRSSRPGCFSGGPCWRRTGTQARIENNGLVALLLTFAHMTLLGALFALTPRPLYHTGLASQAAALADQQLGGVLMLVVSACSYIGGGLWMASRLLGPGEPSRARA